VTTPNTLKATLTGDVGDAQVKIQRLIKTVEDMGRTVNATSAAGQKAFRAEADEVSRLVRELGAGEKQMNRLTAARTSFAQRVQSESLNSAKAAQQMAGAYSGAAANVTKGLASIAEQGKVTAGGLRDIASGAADLAIAFAPGGVIIKGILLAASAIGGAFFAARNEMKETEKTFTETVEGMRRKADAEGIKRMAFDVDQDIKKTRADLALAEDPTDRSVGDMLAARPLIRQLRAQLASQEARAKALLEAAQNPAAQYAPRAINPTRTITAGNRTKSGGKAPGSSVDDSAAAFGIGADGRVNRGSIGVASLGPDAEGIRKVMIEVSRMAAESPFAMIAADVTKPITGLQALRAELASTATDFRIMGDTARFSIEQGIGAGVDALISGRGNVIKELKRAAAEPIVAKLRMQAIEGFANAAKYASNPATFALIPAALAAAAKNTVAAAAVARLGGMAGGGGSEGAGGASGAGGGARSASLPGDGLSAARSDRPVRIEMILVQQTPDGRELARQRQVVQRLDDRNQPIRVVL
jgi:hypothetical protein